ncbi:hypothetical protein AB0M43_05580 [Longispora sp. NPDC051575]|uniref:DUF3885 domain-containing protein n=1 Tax=Longispora sp. NPDC051575 TaxID=3154943 RepID=UPI003442418B
MNLGPAGPDPRSLTERWAALWPECAPVPTRLRAAYPDRWVRFRTLPEGRRCPDSENEYAAVLARHDTVLGDLADRPLLVFTAGYSETLPPGDRDQEITDLQPHGVYWTSVLLTDQRTGYEVHQHLYASRTGWSPGCLDPLLRHVAGDLAATVLVADAELRWLYHPFAGGMDVILPTRELRDGLAARHARWTSPGAPGSDPTSRPGSGRPSTA